MHEFKPLVYCREKNEFVESYDKLLSNQLVSKYTMVKDYFKDLLDSAEFWAIHLLTRSHDTDNYAEASFRVLKDEIFSRLKAFNVCQTFAFLVTRKKNC